MPVCAVPILVCFAEKERIVIATIETVLSVSMVVVLPSASRQF